MLVSWAKTADGGDEKRRSDRERYCGGYALCQRLQSRPWQHETSGQDRKSGSDSGNLEDNRRHLFHRSSIGARLIVAGLGRCQNQLDDIESGPIRRLLCMGLFSGILVKARKAATEAA
ncbi:hypothetical protein [Bradyrhizobium sp. CCGUVB23]|uniref:hypothetical protein n=1 Tax=Bradyrhizobium sp. CCGUVB23 TaxID=2949630 RepID=UPI0020B21A56|nr:hypothetical protein [Bradyrhizobium sp. CCGUVB23]MCP3465198.1 hypothetical protein [Bradyrhizobium sp. CCGUVB23]